MQNENNIHSHPEDNSWRHKNRNRDSFEPSSDYGGYTKNVWNRGSRERRDLFDQFESFMSL